MVSRGQRGQMVYRGNLVHAVIGEGMDSRESWVNLEHLGLLASKEREV